MRKTKTFKNIQERDKYIAKEGLTGRYTLVALGDKVGISREWVRQIFKKQTGQPYRFRLSHLEKRRTEKTQKFLNEIKFQCKWCGTLVKRKDGYRLQNNCRECRDKLLTGSLRDGKVFFRCEVCKKEFNPHRNWKEAKSTKSRFCSKECRMNRENLWDTKKKAKPIRVIKWKRT